MNEAARTEPEFMSDDWIEAHNKRVAAFRREHYPRIRALTHEECERIYARWTTPGMSANVIALEFRDELGMTWSDEHAVGIGMEIMHTVLVRLDKYDPDFRPAPDPVDMGKVGDGVLWYLPASGNYRIELGGESEEFRAAQSPRFGVDLHDMATAEEVVSRLAATSRPKRSL